MGLDSFGFIAVVMKTETVLDCGATETASGGEAVQDLIDAVFENYDKADMDVDTEDRPWFRFAICLESGSSARWAGSASTSSTRRKCPSLPA